MVDKYILLTKREDRIRRVVHVRIERSSEVRIKRTEDQYSERFRASLINKRFITPLKMLRQKCHDQGLAAD